MLTWHIRVYGDESALCTYSGGYRTKEGVATYQARNEIELGAKERLAMRRSQRWNMPGLIIRKRGHLRIR